MDKDRVTGLDDVVGMDEHVLIKSIFSSIGWYVLLVISVCTFSGDGSFAMNGK